MPNLPTTSGSNIVARAARALGPRWLRAVDVATAAAHLPFARTFVAALVASQLVDELRGPGPWTLLVPTDEALRATWGVDLDALFDPRDREAIIDLAELHVARGAVTVGPNEPAVVSTLLGVEATVGNPELGRSDVVPVAASNLVCSNGLVHVLGASLRPPWLGEDGRRIRGRDAA